jgi:hypothetical protein
MAKGARFEGSKADKAEDKKNARKLGMSQKAYERSSQDKKADAKGQRMLNAKARAKKKRKG